MSQISAVLLATKISQFLRELNRSFANGTLNNQCSISKLFFSVTALMQLVSRCSTHYFLILAVQGKLHDTILNVTPPCVQKRFLEFYVQCYLQQAHQFPPGWGL